jgi:adenylate cyclase
MKRFFKQLKSIFYINPASITLTVIFLVVSLFLAGNPILDMIELKTYDLRFRSRGQLHPSTPVVMALIDEKSLDAEGRWPWPRSKIATLVNLLSRDGAKVIGFDIGFLEPDANSQLSIIHRFGQEISALDINNPKLDAFIKEHETNADNDLILAKALKNSSAAIVLGYFFHMSEDKLDFRIEPSYIDQQIERISASKYPLVIYKDKDLQIDPFFKAYAPESNLEVFSQSAASSGYYSVRSDQDGVVRWMPLIIQCGEDLFPPLSVLCVWHYLDEPQLMVKVARYGVEGIQLGERFIPTDENGELLINYLGPPKTFAHISITDILKGRIAAGTFTDKIVLVGATAMGTHDLRSTPVSPLYPGIEIHATVIDNIWTQDFITKPNWSKIFDLLAIISLGALTGAALPRMSAVKGLCFAIGLFALHIIVARWLFVNYRAWLNIVFPLLALSLNYTALTAYYYVTEEKERKRIKGTFRQYVAPLVIDELLKAPDRLKLGGEERVLTVLFSDIAGFTSYAERYTPGEMIEILSDYYGIMTEQIFICQGTLKDYVGDEIMAFFGAPPRADRPCATRLQGRNCHAGATKSPSYRMGQNRPPAFNGPDGDQLGPHARGQPGLPLPFRLRCPGGPGQPRLPSRGAQQGLWNGYPHRGEYRPTGQRRLHHAGGRFGSCRRKAAGRPRLRTGCHFERRAPPKTGTGIQRLCRRIRRLLRPALGRRVGSLQAQPGRMAG